jgi:hypothetical protein
MEAPNFQIGDIVVPFRIEGPQEGQQGRITALESGNTPHKDFKIKRYNNVSEIGGLARVRFESKNIAMMIPLTNLFHYKDDNDTFQQLRAKIGPKKLMDVFEVGTTPRRPLIGSIFHRAARDIESWCSEKEIVRVISNPQFAKTVVRQVGDLLWSLTDWIQKDERQLQNVTLSNHVHCLGCVSLRERADFTAGNKQVRDMPLDMGENPMPRSSTGTFFDRIHLGITRMEVMHRLLLRDDADGILLCVTRAVGISTPDKPMSFALAYFVHMCAGLLPKMAEVAIGLLSVLLIRNSPAVLEYLFDSDNMLFISAQTRLLQILGWLHLDMGPLSSASGATRMLNIHNGTKCSIDLLPILFHLGTLRRNQEEEEALTCMTTHLGALLHTLASMALNDTQDLDRFDYIKELAEWQESSPVYMKSLLVSDGDAADDDRLWRQELLYEKPISFAAAGLVEVLGWWAYKGVTVDANCRGILAKEQKSWQMIWSESPRLAFAAPIIETLIAGETAPPVRETYLLYGPLYFQHQRCGLSSCRKTAEEAGGMLLRCSGGCEGLEQYCCREHQLAHWNAGHKKFCRRV